MNSSAQFAAARFLRAAVFLPLLAALDIHNAVAQTSLTSADIAGPDGIIYPDWRTAGVPGGIPTSLPIRTSITNHGAAANDGVDDAAAIEAAVEAANTAGGGVVTIPSGTFHLSRPLLLRRSNIVLRGAGRNSTKLIFQYKPPTNAVTFYHPYAATTTVYSNTWIEIHADPVGLDKLTILAKNSGAGDSTLQICTTKARADGHWGATFSLSTSGGTVSSRTGGAGSKELVARAEYSDGRILEKRVTYTVSSSSDANAISKPSTLGAINFCGQGLVGGNKVLTANGVRGQTTVNVASGHGFVAGNLVEIRAPATDRWDAEVQNSNTGDLFRLYQYKIASVGSTSVTFTQPLRIDYPTIDGSYLRLLNPISRCAVEGLSVEQINDGWTSGIIFSWANESWAKDVGVKKAGRFPLYFNPGMRCEVRDSVFDDAWFKGDGGTAYVGFERAYDCLMENVTTYKMRHAPLVQWSAAGNVIRNSTFYDSDAQWHAGWTNENLFENCVIISNRGNGAYGYGMWASPPEDTAHGPNGPRNVVYNCDVSSALDGAWLGGMNREWKFLHNRFAIDSGAGLLAKDNSGDHIIENNVFVLRRASAGIRLDDANCDGVELVDNRFIGLPSSRELVAGPAVLTINQGNTISDLVQASPFTNSGFESDLAGWTVDGTDGGRTVVSTSAARTGSKGVRVTDSSTTGGSSLLSANFTVTPGRVYSARCAYRVISGSSGIGLYLRFLNASGTEIRAENFTIGTSTAWALAQVLGTAPAGATTARIWLHSYGSATQTADFDDFSFGEVSHGVANAGFELGSEAWDTSNDGGLSAVSSSAAKNGSLGLRVTDASTTAGSSYMTQSFPASPGNTYQVRFWSRRISGSGIGVYLQWYGSNGSFLSSDLLDIPSSADWKEYLTRAVAPANTASVRVWIHSYSTAVVTADFDDFTLLELPARPSARVPSIFAWQRNPVFPFTNAGFESALNGWDTTGDGGMSSTTSLAARNGTAGLRITDTSTTTGSSVRSERFYVSQTTNYQVSFSARLVSGSGIGVYLIYRDANGVELPGTHILGIPSSATSWQTFSFQKIAPANAVQAEIWIHSYNANVVTADFDDFIFRAMLN